MRRAEHCYIGTGCTGLAHIVVGHTGWQAAAPKPEVDDMLVVVAAPRPVVVAETTVVAAHIVLVVVVVVFAAPTVVGSVHYS